MSIVEFINSPLTPLTSTLLAAAKRHLSLSLAIIAMTDPSPLSLPYRHGTSLGDTHQYDLSAIF